jgi:hypothetical protein
MGRTTSVSLQPYCLVLFLAAEWHADMLCIGHEPTATLFASHSCRMPAFLLTSRLVFQHVLCILLRNPVARFVGKITWIRDRLKRNSLFGAQDGMDLPDGLLSVLYKAQTHKHTQSKSYETINQSAPFSPCTVSSVILSVICWNNSKNAF